MEHEIDHRDGRVILKRPLELRCTDETDLADFGLAPCWACWNCLTFDAMQVCVDRWVLESEAA